MHWKCFQRFLESLTYALIFNLDFAENFVSSIYYILTRTTRESSSSRNVCAYGNAPSARLAWRTFWSYWTLVTLKGFGQSNSLDETLSLGSLPKNSWWKFETKFFWDRKKNFERKIFCLSICMGDTNRFRGSLSNMFFSTFLTISDGFFLAKKNH